MTTSRLMKMINILKQNKQTKTTYKTKIYKILERENLVKYLIRI